MTSPTINIGDCCVIEQAGQLVHAKITAISNKNIRLNSGRKVSRDHVWIVFKSDQLATVLITAKQWRDKLNINLLWQKANGKTLLLPELTAQVADNSTHPGIQWGVLDHIIANPIYFRRFNQQLKPVDKDTLSKAQRSVSDKNARLQHEKELLEQLQNGKVPAAIATDMTDILCQSNKNAPTYQALKKHLGKNSGGFVNFFIANKLLKNMAEYWHLIFEKEWLSPHPATEQSFDLSLPNLPTTQAQPFSIDEEGTCEIDDAFSVQPAPNNSYLIGIHIACPALIGDTALYQFAHARQTSVYSPTQKYLMLPPTVVEQLSLSVASHRPAVSLYIQFNPQQKTWQVQNTTVEKIKLQATLTPDAVEQNNYPANLQADYPILCQFVDAIVARDPLPLIDRSRNFKIDANKLTIIKRDKAPSNITVEALMRFANSHWAGIIAQHNLPALYRYNGGIVTAPPTDQPPYIWLTSPLRRYVDLINQRQLLSHLTPLATLPAHLAPPAGAQDLPQLAKHYELKRAQARTFQQTIDCHWAMVILNQKPRPLIEEIEWTKTGYIRLKNYPILAKVVGPPDKHCKYINIEKLDFYHQQAHGDWV